MFSRSGTPPDIEIQATYGGYPCRVQRLATDSASIEQALLLPPGHRAHLSFQAAGEWFHLAADVGCSDLDRELSMDAGRMVYRTELQFRNVASEVRTHLAQLLQVLALDGSGDSVHTEALQFEIVGF